jgi:hypothetical protein
MKRLWFIVGMIFLVSTFSFSQTKPFHFKKLQEFLPTKVIKEFKRLNPTGSTQNNGGIASSEAAVRYELILDLENLKEGEELPPLQAIDIKIGDMIGIPYFAAALQYQGESESETDGSIQKTTTVKGKYKGQEEIFKAGEGGCKINFAVANRYMITLEASNTKNVKLLYDLIDSIPLDKLESLTPETK